MKIVLNNRKAYHDYEVLEKYEAGIILKGTEIKSIRNQKFNVNDAHCYIRPNLEIELINMHVSPYDFGNRFNHEPLRNRKLLMHKKEIRKLYAKVREKGLSLVPLKFYFKKSYLKVEVGLCRGKKLYDKRESIKQKDIQRDTERALAGNR